jgi:hypothetical protein
MQNELGNIDYMAIDLALECALNIADVTAFQLPVATI